jgi:hypothetical protein
MPNRREERPREKGAKRLYVPPAPESDEPLDAVEQALVEMWLEILLPIVREELRTVAPQDEADGCPTT